MGRKIPLDITLSFSILFISLLLLTFQYKALVDYDCELCMDKALARYKLPSVDKYPKLIMIIIIIITCSSSSSSSSAVVAAVVVVLSIILKKLKAM